MPAMKASKSSAVVSATPSIAPSRRSTICRQNRARKSTLSMA
jgi:hypothetical protein